MRREQMERWLASDGMTVEEWCRLNRMSTSTFYLWLNKFREEEPESFGQKAAKGWVEIAREERRDSLALTVVPAADAAIPAKRAGRGQFQQHILSPPYFALFMMSFQLKNLLPRNEAGGMEGQGITYTAALLWTPKNLIGLPFKLFCKLFNSTVFHYIGQAMMHAGRLTMICHAISA